jgi:LAO/AO transport system kinase
VNATERQALLERFSAGDRRSLSKLISIVENADPGAEPILESLFPKTGRAFRVGVTGPPGAGKSTLIDAFVKELRARERKVGVIAVDPSSPFTGGALLGDRVRLSSTEPDPGFFFRSMATRGSLGGLAATATEVGDLYDAWGMDVVILETVGVGQIELDVVAASECTIVVLVPESGDDVQAMKAGLMEIGDVYVLNKSDRDGADRASREMQAVLALRPGGENDWRPPVVNAIAREGRGVPEILDAVERFREHQSRTGAGRTRRRRVMREKIREATERILRRRLWDAGAEAELEAAAEDALDKRRNPYELADRLARTFGKNGESPRLRGETA